MPKKIALLIANTGSAYYLAKLLSAKQYEVHCIHYENHILSSSKYLKKLHIVQNPSINTQQTVHEIDVLHKRELFDLIIPINDIALELAYLLKPTVPCILLHNTLSQDNYRDKHQLWKLAKALGIPLLNAEMINSFEEYTKTRDNWLQKLPLVGKPQKSAAVVDNQIQKFAVNVLRTQKDIDNYVTDNILKTPILMQEYISGYGVGFNFFAINGELQSFYAHERINEKNNGGMSSYRKTIPADKYDLLAQSKKIIENIKWTGIGMLEYRIYNGIAYIMELNGRPWGSMMLGIYHGSNPILHYINWALNNENKSEIIVKQTHQNEKQYARLLKDEVKFGWSLLRKRKLLSFTKWLIGHYRVLLPNEHIDDLDWTDPNYFFNYWKRPTAQKPLSNSITDVKNLTKLSQIEKVCFVCYGNINRSVFAEGYFKKKFPHVDCISAGTSSNIKRMASLQAIKLALNFGVDIEKHHSKHILSLNTEGFALVCLDYKIIPYLKSLHFSNPIYLLNKNGFEDPHGKDDKDFEVIFKAIQKSIDALAT